ncbi:hypothetical protein GNF18_07535 [Ligilactobacillus pobuzihii]|nr:hypothetical protein [Ligilactobacillus pobuzihii]
MLYNYLSIIFYAKVFMFVSHNVKTIDHVEIVALREQIVFSNVKNGV